MPVVIRASNAQEFRSQLASALSGIDVSLRETLQKQFPSTADNLSDADFEKLLVELVGRAGAYGKGILHSDRLQETNDEPDESMRMMPQHDVDWRALDNLAHNSLINALSTLNRYHELLHKHVILAAETGEASTDKLPRGLQVELIENQSQHLAYLFILQSHLELCSHFGRSGSALLHLDRIRSQVEERSEYRVRLFKQDKETRKNAQTQGREKNRTNKKRVPRKADRSNVSDKRKNQRSGKSYKGVEAKKVKARSSRTAKVRKGRH